MKVSKRVQSGSNLQSALRPQAENRVTKPCKLAHEIVTKQKKARSVAHVVTIICTDCEGKITWSRRPIEEGALGKLDLKGSVSEVIHEAVERHDWRGQEGKD